MELDLQSLFGLHVHSWIGRDPAIPPPPHLGSNILYEGSIGQTR